MTFSFVKPDSGPSPAVDASQIQTNFSVYATAFAVNHTALNDKNEGDHEVVLLTRQITDPDTVANFNLLYSKNAVSKATTEPQVFVRNPKWLPDAFDQTNASNTPMQLTYNQVNTTGPTDFQSFLPGGYILYFGTTTNIAADVILSPAPTKILIAIAEPSTMTSGVNPFPFTVSTVINTSTNDRFTINSTLGNAPYKFTYMAIAVA